MSLEVSIYFLEFLSSFCLSKHTYTVLNHATLTKKMLTSLLKYQWFCTEKKEYSVVKEGIKLCENLTLPVHTETAADCSNRCTGPAWHPR